jgi:ribosomal protein S24E
MEIQINKTRELPLLARKRYTLNLESGGATMSRKDMLKAVAEKIGSKEDRVIIKHIYPQYGTTSVKVIAHEYKDKERLKAFEHDSLIKKHKDEPKVTQ